MLGITGLPRAPLLQFRFRDVSLILSYSEDGADKHGAGHAADASAPRCRNAAVIPAAAGMR